MSQLQLYSHEKEENLLGEGSFGCVYTTSCHQHKKQALKKFYSHSTFVHESEMAIKTKDLRGTVKVKKSFISEGNGYLLMEYCDTDLFTFLRDKNLSEMEALAIFYSICEAVAELHSHNVAHLDLKLENILLTPNAEWKLCDFGSARSFIAGKTQVLGSRTGTPGYCAPEIMVNRSAHPEKADSWSLGIILHALLLHCFPFHNFQEEGPCYANFSLNFVYFSRLSDTSKQMLYNLLSLDANVRLSPADVLLYQAGAKGKKFNSKIRKIKKIFHPKMA